MIIARTIPELQVHIEKYRKRNLKIGFVPTMGALHNGHLSLVEHSRRQSDITVISIFVNPTQFNDPDDLKNYPVTIDSDLEKLERLIFGNDIVFMPGIKDMYPEPDNREFCFGALESVMDGLERPGHFNGVAQIVSKLFDAVNPDIAFFGEKDYQQLLIVRSLAEQLKYDIEIVGCPIVREDDGLAMSSRNELLTNEHRKTAPRIFEICTQAKEMKEQLSLKELKKWVVQMFEQESLLELEYFEIMSGKTLQPVESWEDEEHIRCFVALWAGNVRLIDNIRLK